MTTLEQRITAALIHPTSSQAVGHLIAEAEAAAIATVEIAARARERALDPTILSADLRTARSESDNADFVRDRMATALARLTERKVQMEALEQEQRRREAYDTAKKERDKLARELKEYPAIAEKLADLARRILINNEDVKRANSKMPRNAAWLACAETVARRIEGGFTRLSAPPRIATDLRLPAFHYEQTRPYVWPPNG